MGRGLAYANAYELALKLMETCYVVAERFSSADFLHGPLAMVERHFPVILFAPPGVMLPGVKDLIRRLQELHADTLAITADLEAASLCRRSVIMPREIDEFLAPIPYIIPGQLFAALLAEAKGLGSGCAAFVIQSDEDAVAWEVQSLMSKVQSPRAESCLISRNCRYSQFCLNVAQITQTGSLRRLFAQRALGPGLWALDIHS